MHMFQRVFVQQKKRIHHAYCNVYHFIMRTARRREKIGERKKKCEWPSRSFRHLLYFSKRENTLTTKIIFPSLTFSSRHKKGTKKLKVLVCHAMEKYKYLPWYIFLSRDVHDIVLTCSFFGESENTGNALKSMNCGRSIPPSASGIRLISFFPRLLHHDFQEDEEHDEINEWYSLTRTSLFFCAANTKKLYKKKT